MKHLVTLGERKVKVSLPDQMADGQPFALEIDGKPCRAAWFKAFGVLALIDEQGVERMVRVRGRAAQRFEGEAEVRLGAEVYPGPAAGMQSLQVTVAHDVPGMEGRAKAAGAAGTVVRSQITGKVLKVLVKAGDKVEPGQTLFVVEAMKMENRVFAQAGGTVQSVGVKDGDAVQTGKELARIGP